MHTSSLSLAALALLGAMAMTAPALAASAGPDGLNCKDPALQNDARCLDWAKRSGSPWATRPGDAGKPFAKPNFTLSQSGFFAVLRQRVEDRLEEEEAEADEAEADKA